MDDFQVFVKPVGAICNLACSYCYYLDKQDIYAKETSILLPDNLLEKYIVQHFAASTGPDIFFSWHGGEPLLAGIPFFQRVVEIQQQHLPKNCKVVNGIQTNGTMLTHDWCKFLKNNDFIVGISLDGPKIFHSAHRTHKNGHSSFSEAIRGYQLVKSYEIPCEILCVVSSCNVNYPLEIYRFFKQLKAEFITFLPLVEKRSLPGKCVTEKSVPSQAFGEFLCKIFDEWKSCDIGNVKVQIFEEAIRTAFQLEHTLCIFKKICGGVPVLEHNGDLYACDHYVEEQYRLGNIHSASLTELLESTVLKAFGHDKLVALPRYCLNCEVREMCNGACPKDRFIATPDGEPGLNYLCEGYKQFFNHIKPFTEQVAAVWRRNQQMQK